MDGADDLDLTALAERLRRMESSTSWRITRPIRFIGRVLKRIRPRRASSAPVPDESRAGLQTALDVIRAAKSDQEVPDEIVADLLALEAPLDADFFPGWNPSDVALLARYQVLSREEEAAPGIHVDWLGLRTRKSNFGHLAADNTGSVVSRLPIPDDSLHAGADEYVCLALAIEGGNRQDPFVVVELGASYGPWTVAAAALALRVGFPRVTALAVESTDFSERIIDHAKLNGLESDARFDLCCHTAAVWTNSETVYFPDVDNSMDNGAQATAVDVSVDYRGTSVNSRPVRGVTLRELTRDLSAINFLHIDLQGSEQKLLCDSDFLEVLCETTSFLYLATHSRSIEGLALETLSRRNWTLLREKPTRFAIRDSVADSAGWAVRDGGQIWENYGIKDR